MSQERKYCIDSTEFEIHYAAELDRFPAELRKALLEAGFRDDGLEGHGVIFSPNDPLGKVSCPLTGLHMSWDSFERDAYLEKKEEFDSILNRFEEETTSYAHCEVIKPEWDVVIDFKPFDVSIDWPLGQFESRIERTSKRWDIHISADLKSLDSRLQQNLFDESNMYFIDVRKSSGRVHRVFTIQGKTAVKSGLELFSMLTRYLEAAGGMKGAIKFEETVYWRSTGDPEIVPPLISVIPYLS